MIVVKNAYHLVVNVSALILEFVKLVQLGDIFSQVSAYSVKAIVWNVILLLSVLAALLVLH